MMRFLIAGSSGFLGTRLRERLTSEGHTVTALVRRTAKPGEVQWDPYGGVLDAAAVEEADVVVNLAGSPTLGNPHSKTWSRNLEESRVTTTRVLADAIAASTRKPAFLAGNAVAWYGDHGEEPLPETADSRGHTLMTEVTRRWQDATRSAEQAGARVCLLRTSPVMDRRSAPLKQLARLFRLGLGGPLGNGRQYFPVISARDWTGAVRFLARHEDLSGPVNLCSALTPTNAEFTRALAAEVHRPAVVWVPTPAIRAAAGRAAPEVLGSLRTVPQALLDAGYVFEDPDVASVLHEGLSPSR
jgi:uncharacterized protein